MNYEDIWRTQDEITAAVNALGYSVWNLEYDVLSFRFKMELKEHLDESSASSLCSQLPLTADYEGEGSQGSLFTININQ